MQSITMGSNSIDFMTATPKYHTGVELLAVDLVGQPKKDTNADEIDPFHAWYGYRQSIPPNCENSAKTEDSAQSAELKDSIGVMVVIEAENLSKASLAMSDVKNVLSAAIKELNLSEREVSIQEDIDPNVSIFILNEGYITARVFAETACVETANGKSRKRRRKRSLPGQGRPAPLQRVRRCRMARATVCT